MGLPIARTVALLSEALSWNRGRSAMTQSLVHAGYHGCEQSGARNQMLDDNRLVGGVCAITDCPHSIKRWDSKRGGEIAVGAAPR